MRLHMTIFSENYKRYHYDKAPLQEAIFEAKFFDENYDVTLPGRFFDRVSSKFPEKKEIQNNAIIISSQRITVNKPPNLQTPVIQAWNENHNRCLQVGPGIIAANDTAYLNWEVFSENIQLLLDKYFDCISPSSTQRVGYRCINRFLIPNENIVLSDYFRLNFSLPNELLNPKGLGLNISKEITFNKTNISVIVRFLSDSLRDNETGVALLLDIDSFVTENIDVDRHAILKTATHCHDLEKIIFESLLKDKLRELLGGKEV